MHAIEYNAFASNQLHAALRLKNETPRKTSNDGCVVTRFKPLPILLLFIASTTILGNAQELSGSTTVIIHTSNADSYVESSTPTTNYGTSTKLKVDPKAVSIKRSLLSFDLSSIPVGQVIVKAVLSLYLATPPSVSRILEVHRVTANWTERGVTWNTQPSFQSTPISTNTTGIVLIWVSWTVSTDVASGYATPSKWFGFIIKDSQEPIQGGGSLLDFNSREAAAPLRPQLSVIYALQIPEIPTWIALLLGVGGVGLLWRQTSKRSRNFHQVHESQL